MQQTCMYTWKQTWTRLCSCRWQEQPGLIQQSLERTRCKNLDNGLLAKNCQKSSHLWKLGENQEEFSLLPKRGRRWQSQRLDGEAARPNDPSPENKSSSNFQKFSWEQIMVVLSPGWSTFGPGEACCSWLQTLSGLSWKYLLWTMSMSIYPYFAFSLTFHCWHLYVAICLIANLNTWYIPFPNQPSDVHTNIICFSPARCFSSFKEAVGGFD